MDLAIHFASVSFSFWTLGRWDNPLSDGLYLSRETCNTEVYLGLGLAPCLSLDLNNRLLGGNLFWEYRFYFRFLAMELLNFSPNFPMVHIHPNQCYDLLVCGIKI
jgi:hypothetical protein